MKRAIFAAALALTGLLLAYVFVTEPRLDRPVEEPEITEIIEVIAPSSEELTSDEPLADLEPPIGAATEISIEPAQIADAADPLTNMMRYVDGIELEQSVVVFDWLISEEARDEAWAIPLENKLHDYFASDPELATYFGTPFIHCRQSLCAIQIVGYGHDLDEMQRVWFEAATDLESERPMPDEIQNVQLLFEEIRSDAIGFITLTKNGEF